MPSESGPERRPPRPWRLLARVLLPGREGTFVRIEAEEAFRRDLDRGLPLRRARRRYSTDVLASAWTLHTGRLRGRVARGTLMDVKLGLRMLGKQPLLTVVAMLALGLGIPATLSTLHFVNVTYSPLPVPEGERVMGIREWDAAPYDPVPTTVHDYERWREGLTSFQAVGATRSYTVNVHAEDPSAPPVRGAEITASGLALLRERPLLGRLLDPADETRGAPDVILLREDLWVSRFGADPDIVGRTVRVGRDLHTVVGVLPADFRFPLDDQIWMPLRAHPADYPEGEGPKLKVFGRLAEGVSAEEADLEMARLTARRAAGDPVAYETVTGEVVGAAALLMERGEFFENNPDWLLMKALLFFMLFVVCGNVGVLVLARTSTRQAEITIRTALGASRARIVLQVFVETLVLALLATGLGLAFAQLVANEVMRRYGQVGLQYWVDLGLTPEVVAVALILAVGASVVAGVVPALRATGPRVQANLQRAAGGAATLRFGLGSSALIVTEVVLSVGFLALGGTMIRTAFQDTEGGLGLDPGRFAVGTVVLPPRDHLGDTRAAADTTRAQREDRVREEVLAKLLEAPGVVAAGLGSSLPGGTGGGWRVTVEGMERPPSELQVGVGRQWVAPSFFRTLDRPILAGRGFTAGDVEGEPGAHRVPVVVNSSFVEQVLRGRQPIGRRFRYQLGSDTTDAGPRWHEIVGVVGSFGTNVINPRRDAAVYHPLAEGELPVARYLVEVPDDPAGFGPRFRKVVAAVEPEATVVRTMSLSAVVDGQKELIRWVFFMQLALAGVAFLLSISGLYALMSFTVSQRTREIGIRTALGAKPWAIVKTVARRAAAQLAVGLALGAAWGWYLLDQINQDAAVVPMNLPLVLGVTVACAALVGTLACLSPLLRGIRIQPTEALRES